MEAAQTGSKVVNFISLKYNSRNILLIIRTRSNILTAFGIVIESNVLLSPLIYNNFLISWRQLIQKTITIIPAPTDSVSFHKSVRIIKILNGRIVSFTSSNSFIHSLFFLGRYFVSFRKDICSTLKKLNHFMKFSFKNFFLLLSPSTKNTNIFRKKYWCLVICLYQYTLFNYSIHHHKTRN